MCSRGMIVQEDGEEDAHRAPHQAHHPPPHPPHLSDYFHKEGSESPPFPVGSPHGFPVPKMVLGEAAGRAAHELPNEISAPYEVPQFPIEQIEKKLAIQRQISSRRSTQVIDKDTKIGIENFQKYRAHGLSSKVTHHDQSGAIASALAIVATRPPRILFPRPQATA